jgi:hypothetical protein
MERKYNRILITADSDWSDINKTNEVIQEIFQKCLGYKPFVYKKREIDYNKKIENEVFPKILSDPFIYVRDRKSDNRLKSVLTHFGYRIIQFRADWDTEKDGTVRNERIFNTKYKVDLAICLTKWQQENDGMDYIINKCILDNIPTVICDTDPVGKNVKYEFKSFLPIENLETTIISKPVEKEKYTELSEEDKTLPKYGSVEWKNKMEETRKMMKQIYFSNKNSTTGVKILSEQDVIDVNLKKLKSAKVKASNRTKARKVNKVSNVKKLQIKTSEIEEEEVIID